MNDNTLTPETYPVIRPRVERCLSHQSEHGTEFVMQVGFDVFEAARATSEGDVK